MKKQRPKPKKSQKTSFVKGMIFWALLFLFFLFFISLQQGRKEEMAEISYSKFYTSVDSGKVASITIAGKEIRGEFKEPVEVKSASGGEKLKVKSYKKFKT
ncbi:ATP-dependent metallopeptidase FtsH/Yme1/Tma family protein, partial [candidate division WOR-3 bacterium]|nr:ATP-dependent metallopeptidase FtsH/Yme1/Tma family protein [candidate division WOR-3 bacterium]